MSNARDRGLDWLRSTGTGSSLRSPVRKVKVRPDVVSCHVRARGSLDDETRALAPLLMGDADHDEVSSLPNHIKTCDEARTHPAAG